MGISKQKEELAINTTADLVSVIKGTMSGRLSKGLCDLFQDMQSKHLERLRGLLAGVSDEEVATDG